MSALEIFLSHSYTYERFRDFIAETFTEHSDKILQSRPQAYKEGKIIESYTQICQNIPLDSTHTLGVYAFETSSHNAQAKITLHKEIASILKNREESAILACFYEASSTLFRLSLISQGFDYEANALTFSNPRRQSFVLGQGAKIKTAREQLSKLQEECKASPTIFENLENAFSLEPVTKEFYDGYNTLYERIISLLSSEQSCLNALQGYENLTGEKAIKAFVKKLLGRIVFLYFLQKKGWLGVEETWGSGDKEFLKTLFKRAQSEGKSFYESYLCRLFFESLNTKRKGDYSPYFGCKIPFLNGGLFEESFKNPKDPATSLDRSLQLIDTLDNAIFEDIFEFFDLYNFTIEESVPNDVEISIDPEMLGKIFENLIDYNHDTGAYYTPRAIVHFMCKEALIYSLATKLSENSSLGNSPLAQSLNDFGGWDSMASSESSIDSVQGFTQSHISAQSADLEKLESIREATPRNQNLKSEQIQNPTHHDISNNIKDALFDLIHHHNIDNPFIRTHAPAIRSHLKSLKILDPAIGSGAFPMGLLSEILNLHALLHKAITGEELDAQARTGLKREIIAHQIYGIDIDCDAIEIARLRFWLSIAVDEDTPSPLPNLDFKFMQGNSLLEQLCGIDIIPSNLNAPSTRNLLGEVDINASLFDTTQAQELSRLFESYYTQSDHKDKEALKSKILKLMKKAFDTRIGQIQSQIIANQNNTRGQSNDRAKQQEQILRLSEFKQALQQLYSDYESKNFHTDKLFLYRFFFAPVFSEGGFDIIIGNPPYIGEKGHKELFEPIKKDKLKEFYLGKMDYFYFFFHLGFDKCKPNGILSFITTNYYPTALGAKKLRIEFQKRQMIECVNFNEFRVFETAKGQHNMITTLQNTAPYTKAQIYTFTQDNTLSPPSLYEVLKNRTAVSLYESENLYEGEECYMRLTPQGTQEDKEIFESIFSKLTADSKLLGEIYRINQGIVSGIDKVTDKHLKKYDWGALGIRKGDGVYILSDAQARAKNLESAYLKPCFKNSDIAKYYAKPTSSERILYLTGKENPESIPNILRHLQTFRENLEERREVHKGSRLWWSLWRSRKQDIFETAKIVCPQRSKSNTFGYNEGSWYASADVYFITPLDSVFQLKYILALLNSKLYYFWLYYKGKRKGETLELYQIPLSEIPIKPISLKEQGNFVALVEQILESKAKDYQADTSELESKIDSLVYELYGLTENEIEMIENAKDS